MSAGPAARHDLEAERSTLGAIFLADVALGFVIDDGLASEDFYREQHRTVYQAMVDLRAASQGVDVVTVMARLRETGRLEEAGGEAGVEALAGMVPDAGHVRAYAHTVRDLACKRRIATHAAELAEHPGSDRAAEALAAVLAGGTNGRRPDAAAPADIEAIRRSIFDDGQIVGKCGEEVDEPIPGTNGLLYRGADHMIFAPRESAKTFVMLTVLISAANAGERVLYLDLENGEQTMRERVEAILDANPDWLDAIDSGALTCVSWPALSRAWRPEAVG